MAALGAIGVAAAFAYGLWWVSGVRAVGFTGTGGGGAIGMRLLPPTDAASYDLPADAPPTYGWRRGATILYGFVFHNSLSVPITVTGPTGDEDGQTGLLTEPRL